MEDKPEAMVRLDDETRRRGRKIKGREFSKLAAVVRAAPSRFVGDARNIGERLLRFFRGWLITHRADVELTSSAARLSRGLYDFREI